MSITIINIALCAILLIALFDFQAKQSFTKHQPITSQTGTGFTSPVLIYSSNIKGQAVTVDYSKYVGQDAKRVEFVIFFDIGDAGASATCWIKVSNTVDFHYNLMRGRSPASSWYTFSESFIFPVDSAKNVKIQVGHSFPGTNHVFSLYVSGYYSN